MRSRRKKGSTFLALICLAGIGAGTWFLTGDRLPGQPIDLGSPPPAAIELTVEERAFYDSVVMRLRAVTAESEALVALGQARSRNILELQRRSDRVEQITTQIDEFIAASGIPDRFTEAVAHYVAGIKAVRAAESATRTGFLSFGWDAIDRAVEGMASGAMNLRTAQELLERAADIAFQPSAVAFGSDYASPDSL